MGGFSTPELPVAVSEAGGVGMIGGVMLPAAAIAEILAEIGRRTEEPFGVNFLVPFVDRQAVEAAASLVRVVDFFYGDPDASLVEAVHAGGALAGWQVGSVEEARAAEEAGCDFVIAQGIEAGGHVRGRLGLLALLPLVLEAVPVPVLAAGGIATPRAVAAALAAGADAVRIGTRFVASTESPADPTYVQALLAAKAEDAILTDVFSVTWPDAPHRVLRSSLEAADAFEGEVVGELEMGGQKLPVARHSVVCPAGTVTGEVPAMALYAGQSVGAIDAVEPAGEIVRRLAQGAERLLEARAAI
jgi:nitronate monooxygenase